MFQVLNMSDLGICFQCVKCLKSLVSVFQGLCFRYFEACIQGVRSLNSLRSGFQSLILRCLGTVFWATIFSEIFQSLCSGCEVS